MGSGGARTRSGPAPDPHALRRERDSGEWTTLPAEGRTEPAPAWPLEESSQRELVLWTRLWTKPQAFMWERYDQVLDVALYVRRFAEAEAPGSPVVLSTLVRQMADSLGLSTPGMRTNRWRIQAAPAANVEAPTDTTGGSARKAPRQTSSRARLKVISGDGES